MTTVYCRNGYGEMNNFYINVDGKSFFLFSQKKRKGVESFYRNGVELRRAIRHNGVNDVAIHRTMDKLPIYIKYVEKEFGIIVLEKTRRRSLRVA